MLEALEGGDQADQPQLGRMQSVRQIVHAPGDVRARGSAASSASVLALVLTGAAQQLEIDRQERHLLADVVVQLARDPGALGFLRVQQPRPRSRMRS